MQLVIETAGFACSVALLEGESLIAERHDVIQRGHAERLVPMLAELPDGGRADAILVGCGPGSFTGVRVGISAARALGLAWGVPVHGCHSLALVAAAAFAEDAAEGHAGGDAVSVVMEGGHGEVFIQSFSRLPFEELSPLASVPASEAGAMLAGQWLAGNAASRFDPVAKDSHARASAALWLPPCFTRIAPTPVYGRGADAKPMAAA